MGTTSSQQKNEEIERACNETTASFTRGGEFYQDISGSGNTVVLAGNIEHQSFTAIKQPKDQHTFLQDKLKQKYLKETPLQNIPWLSTKKYIDDQFVDLQLERTNSSENKVIYENILIEDIFKSSKDKTKDRIKNIIIEGKLGNGKSTLCWHLAREWANEKEFMKYFNFVFVIPLRQLRRLTIKGYIQREYSACGVVNILGIIKSKKVLLILDGLDEVQNRNEILQEIKKIRKNLKFDIILTTRPIEVNETFGRFQIMRLNGFDLEGVEKFLEQCFREWAADEKKRIKDKLLENNNIKELSHCPLFLMLFCLLIENNMSSCELPQSQTELFQQAVNFIVQRYFSKLNSQPNIKIDLFEMNVNKQLNQYIRSCLAFGSLAVKSLQKGEMIFSKQELKESDCDLLVQLGLLVKTDNFEENETYQVFHALFLEFFICFYLKHLFFSDKFEFESKLKQVFEILKHRIKSSLIVPFIFGLMKDKIIEVIKGIPFCYFYSREIDLYSALKECTNCKEDIFSLFDLFSDFLLVRVSFNDKGIQILNQNFNTSRPLSCQSLQNTPFLSHRGLFNTMDCCNIEVHSQLFSPEAGSCCLQVFENNTFHRISLKFMPNKKSQRHLCFTDPELQQLMELILERKPRLFVLYFPNCQSCDLKLLHCMLRTPNSSLLSLTVLQSHFSLEFSELISQVSRVYKVRQLHLISDQYPVAKEIVSLSPLIREITDSSCKIIQLSLIDIQITQSEMDQLIEAIDQSKFITHLDIKYPGLTKCTIDLSKLLKNKQKHLSCWNVIKLRNLKVVVSGIADLYINELSLINCQFKESDLEMLIILCKIKCFHCDSELLSYLNELEYNSLLFKSVESLTVKGTFGICSQFRCRLYSEMFRLIWDLLCPAVDLTTSEKNLKALLCKEKICFLTLKVSLNSKLYLNQIEIVSKCLSQTNGKNKIKELCLDFYPQLEECGITSKERLLDVTEISQLVQSVHTFCSFVFTGVIHVLRVTVHPFQNKGHELRVITAIEEEFKQEEGLIIDVQRNYLFSRISIYSSSNSKNWCSNSSDDEVDTNQGLQYSNDFWS